MRPAGTPGPAYRVETARLLLRCWDPADAVAATPVMAESDAHLRRFIPFTTEAARDLDEMVAWLREHRARFDRDEHYRYVALDRATGALIGEAMLLDREQRGDREVGYWIGQDHCRRGYATEAAAAMVALAFEVEGVDEVALSCASANLGSVALARRLGFSHVSTTPREDPVSEHDTDSMRWVLPRADYPASPAATRPILAVDALGRMLLARQGAP